MKKDKTMLDQIIEYCSKNGITSYELAKHLPLSQVALHGILSGTTLQPRIKNVKLIYDFLFENNNIVNEPEPVYETGYDRKIAEAEKKIADLETKLTSNDPNLTPLAAEQIKDIITILYKEIKILSQAKISRMEDEMEDNK